jgi:hypothetical protein
MRRASLLILLLVSCKKEQQATPAKGSAAPEAALAGDAAVATPDAAAAVSIHLLPAVPSTIRLSSRVKNNAIKPEHIADGKLETAWNSATGELKGAWVEVSVDGASIDAIKLTVGHTGRGAKGEDYFTMNPRIRAVTITDDGKPLGRFELDITKRELQTIRVAPKGILRITVDEIEKGSKAKWRETAISELEVWGTPAPGWKPPEKPLVPAFEVAGVVVAQAPDPCANIEDEREEFNRTHDFSGATGPGADDHNYPPTCADFDLPIGLGTLHAPWSSGVARCYIHDEIYGPQECTITFAAGSRTAVVGVGEHDKAVGVEVTAIEEKDVIAGGEPELVVRLTVDEKPRLVVCRSRPTLACSDAIDTGGKDDASAIAAHPLKF